MERSAAAGNKRRSIAKFTGLAPVRSGDPATGVDAGCQCRSRPPIDARDRSRCEDLASHRDSRRAPDGGPNRRRATKRPPRVFISSTIKDLANERDAARAILSDLGLEVVNAENWLPTGRKVWDQIRHEIGSSDLFILIGGDRYGSIPRGQRFSVTHLEFEEAVRNGLPTLVFLKRLAYDGDRQTSEARKRDTFRKRLTDYNVGYLVAEFCLASDLATKIRRSVLDVLFDRFLSDQPT